MSEQPATTTTVAQPETETVANVSQAKTKQVAKKKAPKAAAAAPAAASSTPAPAAAKPAKAAAAKNPKPAANHPKFIEMIVDALRHLNEKSGSSRQAIVKYIVASHKLDVKFVNQHVKLALKNGVKNGALKQSKVKFGSFLRLDVIN